MLNDCLAAREGLAGDKPKNMRDQLDVGWTHMALATVHWKAARLDLADRGWTTGLRAIETTVADEPDDSKFRDELANARIQVADKLLRLGLWERADELLNRVFRRKPASLADCDCKYCYVHAMLRLRAGDADGFRAVCAELFNQFKNIDNKFNLYRACWLGPNALSDMKVLVPLVDGDLARHRADPWYIVHAAMIHMRAGESEKAMEILESRPAKLWNYPANGSMLALIYQDLKQVDKSRGTLDQARRYQDDELRARLEDTVKPPGVEWMDSAILRELLFGELCAKLDGKPSKDNPYLSLIRGQSLARMGRETEAGKESDATGSTRPDNSQIALSEARILAELAIESRNSEAGRAHSRSWKKHWPHDRTTTACCALGLASTCHAATGTRPHPTSFASSRRISPPKAAGSWGDLGCRALSVRPEKPRGRSRAGAAAGV